MLLNPYRFTPRLLPTIADDNSTFNDEGDATTGWSTSGCSVASSSGVLRATKSTAAGSGACSATKSVTFVPSNRDWILYGKVKVSNGTNHIGVIWLLNGSKEAAIWLGTSAANTTYTDNAVSLVGTTGASTRNVASAGTFDFTTDWYEFALQFDFKFSALTLWQRQTDGTWDYKARVACDYFAPSPSSIQVLMTTNTPINSWIEFDYLTICRPNIVVMGDSIAEGKTLFSPDRTLGLTNEESTWMRHAAIYTSLRNNIIVNKGVGSQSSTTITARIAEATDQTPRVVFLHASSNDEALSVSKATRSANIESAITSIEAASAECVLLNAMYGTSGSADNPDLRDYMLDWWNNYAPILSPAPYLSIDIMQAVLSAGYMNASLTQSDGIHPTQGAAGGYGLIGDLIETYDP